MLPCFHSMVNEFAPYCSQLFYKNEGTAEDTFVQKKILSRF